MTADSWFAVKFGVFTGRCRFYDHHDDQEHTRFFWVKNEVFCVDSLWSPTKATLWVVGMH